MSARGSEAADLWSAEREPAIRMKAMMEAQQLSKHYTVGGRKVVALEDVSVHVEPGRLTAVVGPSGSGKTTLLLMLAGLIRPTAGKVLVEGTDLYEMSTSGRAAWRAENVGFVFQTFHLVPYLSVLDNVLLPAGAIRVDGDPVPRARAIIERVGLTERIDHLPRQLSAGESQRTALARALLNQPRLLVADEPTGNLDAESARRVLAYLQEFSKEGVTVLLATHDELLTGAANATIRLSHGKLA
jgi:ABC-type lipoprotein export system ATPase subunit